MMSIQTPAGIYTPRRVLQGGTDSANHFQAVRRDNLEGRVSRMLQWIDEFLLHAPNEVKLLEDIAEFLAVCEEFGFKVHVAQCAVRTLPNLFVFDS